MTTARQRVLDLHRQLCRLDSAEASASARRTVAKELRTWLEKIPREDVAGLLEEAYRDVSPEQLARALARRAGRRSSGVKP